MRKEGSTTYSLIDGTIRLARYAIGFWYQTPLLTEIEVIRRKNDILHRWSLIDRYLEKRACTKDKQISYIRITLENLKNDFANNIEGMSHHEASSILLDRYAKDTLYLENIINSESKEYNEKYGFQIEMYRDLFVRFINWLPANHTFGNLIFEIQAFLDNKANSPDFILAVAEGMLVLEKHKQFADMLENNYELLWGKFLSYISDPNNSQTELRNIRVYNGDKAITPKIINRYQKLLAGFLEYLSTDDCYKAIKIYIQAFLNIVECSNEAVLTETSIMSTIRHFRQVIALIREKQPYAWQLYLQKISQTDEYEALLKPGFVFFDASALKRSCVEMLTNLETTGNMP